MKQMVLNVVCLLCAFGLMVCGNAVAGESPDSEGVSYQETGTYGLSLGYGQSRDDIDIFRLGLQKTFGTRWFESNTGYLSGFFELSYNYWEKSGEETHGIALSPVFAYYFDNGSQAVRPYIEGGIGAALIDDYTIAGRNLSTSFQFEDRIGFGFRFDRFDLNFRYMHYSNASIKDPNDGIDIWIGTFSWYF